MSRSLFQKSFTQTRLFCRNDTHIYPLQHGSYLEGIFSIFLSIHIHACMYVYVNAQHIHISWPTMWTFTYAKPGFVHSNKAARHVTRAQYVSLSPSLYVHTYTHTHIYIRTYVCIIYVHNSTLRLNKATRVVSRGQYESLSRPLFMYIHIHIYTAVHTYTHMHV